MIEFIPYPFFACILLLLVALFFLSRNHRHPVYLVFFTFLGLYFILVLAVTLFPIPVLPAPQSLAAWYRQLKFTLVSINFNPLHSLQSVNFKTIRLDIILNMLMTVPIGFGFPFIARMRIRNVIRLSLIGLLIEATQLIISIWVGPYRSVDLTDVLTNGAGVWLGFGLFRLIGRFYITNAKPLSQRTGDLAIYLQEIFNISGVEK